MRSSPRSPRSRRSDDDGSPDLPPVNGVDIRPYMVCVEDKPPATQAKLRELTHKIFGAVRLAP